MIAAIAIAGLVIGPATAANAAQINVGGRSCSSPNWTYISSEASGATTHTHVPYSGNSQNVSFVNAGAVVYRQSKVFRSISNGFVTATAIYAGSTFCGTA